MPELLRYQKRLRVVALVALALALLAAWGWLRPAVTPAAGTTAPTSPEALEELRERLAAANHAERLRLIQALGQTSSALALDSVIDTLRHARSNRTRAAMIAELGRLGTPAALGELEAIASSAHPGLRRAAIAAIGESSAEGATACLQRLLRRPEMRRYRDNLISALGATGSERSVELLSEIAVDSTDKAQRIAIAALGRTGDGAAFVTLRELARSGSEQVRMYACSALGDLGTRDARDALLRLASQGTSQERSNVLHALSNYHDERVKRFLVQSVGDTNESVAQSALQALTWIDVRLPAAALKRAFQSRHIDVRLAAVSALGQADTTESRDQLVALLSDPTLASRAAAELAGRTYDQPDTVLLETLQAGDAAPSVQLAAIETLANGVLDDVGTRTLDRIAKSGNNDLAVRALQIAADKQGAEAVELLLERYENGTDQLRSAALSILAEIDAPHARDVLAQIADTGDRAARARLLQIALADTSGDSQPFLRRLVESGTSSERAQALTALARQGDDAARGTIMADLRRGEVGVAWPGEQLSDPGLRAQLFTALSDQSIPEQVKSTIADTLSEYASTSELVTFAEHPNDGVATAALRTLGQRGDHEAQRALETALLSDKQERREAALLGLETIGTPAAVTSIATALQSEQTFPIAALILARTGGAEAMSHLSQHYASASDVQRRHIILYISDESGKHGRALLERALNDTDEQIVSHAARVLADTGDPRVTSRLMTLLRHSDSQLVRQMIAQSLQQAGGAPYEQYKALVDEVLAGSS